MTLPNYNYKTATDYELLRLSRAQLRREGERAAKQTNSKSTTDRSRKHVAASCSIRSIDGWI